jgi:Na+-transporting methylmalonyl-CoA/oxaloacetate decarboxylase gamma subunit
MNANRFNASARGFTNTGFKAPGAATTPTSIPFSDKVSGLMSSVKGAFSGSSGIIIAFVILMLAFLLVIIYIVSQLRNNAYKKGTPFTSKIIDLNDRGEPVEVPGASLPTQSMGAQYTFSFWLYTQDLVQTPGFHKLVFYRGEKGNIQTANPIVFMDQVTNKLYFALQPMGESLSSIVGANYENLADITKQNYFLQPTLKYGDSTTNKYMIIPVSNVPFNRWVHLALSVKDNVVTTFLDGEVYSVNTVNDVWLSRTPTIDDVTRPLDPPILQNTLSGSVFIGRNQTLGGGYGVNGYLSKLGYYNYAMTVQDVSKIYNEGAMSNNRLLSAFGMKQYGVRSPFYKLSTVA